MLFIGEATVLLLGALSLLGGDVTDAEKRQSEN
jgi:hypothetical protein